MKQLLSTLLLITGSLHAEKQGPVAPDLHEPVPMEAIEVMYKAFKDMAAQHQGELHAEVVDITVEMEKLNEPEDTILMERLDHCYLVFKVTKVLSGAMSLNDPAQTHRMLLLSQPNGIFTAPSVPLQFTTGFAPGQAIKLRYALGIKGAQTGVADSKLAYHFSLIEEP